MNQAFICLVSVVECSGGRGEGEDDQPAPEPRGGAGSGTHDRKPRHVLPLRHRQARTRKRLINIIDRNYHISSFLLVFAPPPTPFLSITFVIPESAFCVAFKSSKTYYLGNRKCYPLGTILCSWIRTTYTRDILCN